MPEPTVDTPDGEMPAHVWHPPKGSGPGILVLQEIFGVSAYIERRAADLAALGYVVVAPEIFWRLGVFRVEEVPHAFEEAYALLQRTDWASWASATEGGSGSTSRLTSGPTCW
jgi:carboxymethylenebutenolidase